MSLGQQFAIAVDDDHRVVHHHTEHHNQCSQGDGIQLYSRQIHYSQRNSDADWQTCRADQRCAQGEEHQHYRNDNEHGDDQILQKRAYALVHHTRLVGDLMHAHIRRQHRLHMLEHLIHFLAESHDVSARLHLYIHELAASAAVTIISTYILGGVLITPLDGSYIL